MTSKFKKDEYPFGRLDRRQPVDPAVLEALGGSLPSSEQLRDDEERLDSMSAEEQAELSIAFQKIIEEVGKERGNKKE
jgi:hypothetical protein